MVGFPTAREAGVLLPVFSLPGRGAIGGFGDARRFVDWLAERGFRWWQTLPIHPTSARRGDSPYSAASAFALDPALVDPEALRRDGLLTAEEARRHDGTEHVRWDVARRRGRSWLAKAWDRVDTSTRDRVAAFARDHAWVDAWAEFAALAESHPGTPWPAWPPAATVDREAVERATFEQWTLRRQWGSLRRYAARRGVSIFGDVPMYVVAEGCDVWRHRGLFDVADDGRARREAGVPPDAFSADGQCWQMPVFDWEAHAASGFRWWLDRLRAELDLFDLVRLDHFRGFAAYWAVAGGSSHARDGTWEPGPGRALFDAVRATIGLERLVAEDLGVIDDGVLGLLEAFDLPGMRVARFALGADAEPHHDVSRAPLRSVAYTTTHDNRPIACWWQALDGAARTSAAGKVGVDPAAGASAVASKIVERVLDSPARLAIVSMADLAGLGASAIINRPGVAEGNWRWRATLATLAAAERTLETLDREAGSLR